MQNGGGKSEFSAKKAGAMKDSSSAPSSDSQPN